VLATNPSDLGHVRVLSDLHFGHSACVIDEAHQLAPLLEGADTIVFNGDTLEERAGPFVRRSEEMLVDLREACRAAGAKPVFLTGNHDPGAWDRHYLDLAGGKVFVTHGDAFFELISPWSKNIHETRAGILEIRARYSAGELRELDTLMACTKEACKHTHIYEKSGSNGFLNRVRVLTAEMWPPRRPAAILHSWATAPGRAFDLLGEHRPDAKAILFGHTHFPGIWKKNGATALNTGGYLGTLNARAIDIPAHGNSLTYHRVQKRGGRFHRGRAVKTLDL
jgi:predicted phosphodiesterase